MEILRAGRARAHSHPLTWTRPPGRPLGQVKGTRAPLASARPASRPAPLPRGQRHEITGGERRMHAQAAETRAGAAPHMRAPHRPKREAIRQTQKVRVLTTRWRRRAPLKLGTMAKAQANEAACTNSDDDDQDGGTDGREREEEEPRRSTATQAPRSRVASVRPHPVVHMGSEPERGGGRQKRTTACDD
nr:unnamed protein product [Digitaria exilis]